MSLPKHLTHQRIGGERNPWKKAPRAASWVEESHVPAGPVKRLATNRLRELCPNRPESRSLDGKLRTAWCPHKSCGAWVTFLEMYADRFECDPRSAERHLRVLWAGKGRRRHTIPVPLADRVAILCDTHPYLVLGDSWIPKERKETAA